MFYNTCDPSIYTENIFTHRPYVRSTYDYSNSALSNYTNSTYTYYPYDDCSYVVMSTISKRKQKRSDIEAYYRNESKTF
jgi:hypothetical protein